MAEHTHQTEQGLAVKCYHHCRGVFTSVGFWIGMTVGYPLEHALWEHVYPFTLIMGLLGLSK